MEIKEGKKLSSKLRALINNNTSQKDRFDVQEEVGVNVESIRLILMDINPRNITSHTEKSVEPLLRKAMSNQNKYIQENKNMIESYRKKIQRAKSDLKLIDKEYKKIENYHSLIMGRI